MATKKEVQSWMNQIRKREDAVARERDMLDSVIEEMEGLRECCDEAFHDLQCARDALSKLV